MRSTTAEKPETTPIPVQLSDTEFHEFIFPHLSMPKRGPQCKMGYHRVFNLILWVLYTGMQWKCLPVPQDPTVTGERRHILQADGIVQHFQLAACDRFHPRKVSHPIVVKQPFSLFVFQ